MEFIQYLPEALTAWHLLVLVCGVVGGLILGATPGLSPTMAVALLIPFTFHMTPISGLILLGAVYTATVAGGAVSAILVNIPGAPANIATLLDGHPMAQQGRATEALHYCFISSFIGGVLGVAVLIFFTPILADFALRFGPSELFWIALLGVTVIGSLGAKSVLKGLFAGAFGIWLSTIGYDPVLGEERFVFTSHLAGGINIIAALIGLFAIPQVLTMLEAHRRGSATLYDMERRRLWTSIADNCRRLRALSIGGIAGVLVGLIPGAGGQISGLIAYDQTKKFSRDSDRFGKGERDGVISAEAANNAMVGPSLVPLLTLGVPGSPTAAVLLGGLLINGLFPGPALFTTHAKITWTFIDTLLLAQIFMVVFGLTISRYSRFVTRIPNNFMAAAVTVLAVFGTYSVQNNFSDVLVMMVLGTGMYFAMKVGFSPGPVVLGIILGPIAETNFMQGRLIAQSLDGTAAYFFTGTLNIVLIGLCLISIIYSAYVEIRSRRKGAYQWQRT
ncbi:MAG: tripartite tricarboxylate transporter permease [Gammaproteobacteria bacterium]|nr:tripartite tricarboxylate transporter permease [Gammaproteobacteria bacterium]NIR82520.1 tripartite tricarboxylate transporter permease [Gammaproteobacteria bacterium]NIU03651.1 tripartite tricarboxylate transporter permease [Gammaproteobacteria bacterium]NIX84925.1 C4-dicarboxylate ABC transporter permease [Gammaproteobacteria bacterium]